MNDLLPKMIRDPKVFDAPQNTTDPKLIAKVEEHYLNLLNALA